MNPIEVILITGFLGAGKTTLLNRMIAALPAQRRLMVLMNEFGDIGIDGRLVAGEDLDMVEISKGSIFCVCVKTDFIRALATIARDVQPDLLLIEATGVANPSDFKRDLNLPLFKDHYRLGDQICLIDAENFLDAYDTFTAVERQIESATAFVINKIDCSTPESLKKVRQIVCQHHPDPLFFETTHADLPLERFLPAVSKAQRPAAAPKALSQTEVTAAVDALLAEPNANLLPPDELVSVVFRWRGTDRHKLQRAADEMPAGIVRAKGFLEVEHDGVLFNRVMATTAIENHDLSNVPESLRNRLVCIGTHAAVAAMTARMQDRHGLQPEGRAVPVGPRLL